MAKPGVKRECGPVREVNNCSKPVESLGLKYSEIRGIRRY
jgi:hypothetical protein